MQYKNFLVIQTAFIGDAILASSLLEKLHAFFPDARLSILVRKGNEGLYEQHPFLKEVLVWDKQHQKLKHLFQLLSHIRAQKYDCVVNCHRFASSGLLTAFSGARHKSGYKQNPFSFMFNTAVRHDILIGKHEIERYNQLIEDFTDPKTVKPKLYASQAHQKSIEAYTSLPYVVIAPASVWFTKQLPVNKWVELCQKLDPAVRIYLVGAKCDMAMANQIAEGVGHPRLLNLCGQLSLMQTFALISSAEMTYANDSAPLHLASAANAPVTAFFLSTIPLFGFGPLSDNSTVKEVTSLKCRPCGIHGHKTCPQGHFRCAQHIQM
jgi:heptosyltransferase-2